jgi:hypothetical protein
MTDSVNGDRIAEQAARMPGANIAAEPGWTCPRCGGEVLATAGLPHRPGTTQVLLCSRCDAADPVAGPIVTFFTVHETVTPDTVEEFATLLHRWAAHVKVPELDVNALDAEVEAWRRGEL